MQFKFWFVIKSTFHYVLLVFIWPWTLMRKKEGFAFCTNPQCYLHIFHSHCNFLLPFHLWLFFSLVRVQQLMRLHGLTRFIHCAYPVFQTGNLLWKYLKKKKKINLSAVCSPWTHNCVIKSLQILFKIKVVYTCMTSSNNFSTCIHYICTTCNYLVIYPFHILNPQNWRLLNPKTKAPRLILPMTPILSHMLNL